MVLNTREDNDSTRMGIMKSKSTLKKEAEMFNGVLPVVDAEVTVERQQKGNTIKTIPVEVLTVNFNTGTMRVRFMGKVYSDDWSIVVDDIDNTPYTKVDVVYELEYKLGCVLDIATGGRISKPYTDMTHISNAIHDKTMQDWEAVVKDHKENGGL